MGRSWVQAPVDLITMLHTVVVAHREVDTCSSAQAHEETVLLPALLSALRGVNPHGATGGKDSSGSVGRDGDDGCDGDDVHDVDGEGKGAGGGLLFHPSSKLGARLLRDILSRFTPPLVPDAEFALEYELYMTHAHHDVWAAGRKGGAAASKRSHDKLRVLRDTLASMPPVCRRLFVRSIGGTLAFEFVRARNRKALELLLAAEPESMAALRRPAPLALTAAPAVRFRVGDRVEVQHSRGGWCTATVRKTVAADGGTTLYCLDWDDGEHDDAVQLDDSVCRLSTPARAQASAGAGAGGWQAAAFHAEEEDLLTFACRQRGGVHRIVRAILATGCFAASGTGAAAAAAKATAREAARSVKNHRTLDVLDAAWCRKNEAEGARAEDPDPHAQKRAHVSRTVAALVERYRQCIVIGIDNVQSKQLQEIRRALRGQAEILCGANALIHGAFGDEFGRHPALAELLEHVTGHVGLMFTDVGLGHCRSMLDAHQIPAPALAGAVAQTDVFVEKGPTGMGPSKTSFFQAVGVPTKIAFGTIAVLSRHRVCEAGEKVGLSEAKLLAMLGISPFFRGVILKQVMEDGHVFPPEVLATKHEGLLGKVMGGISDIAAISL